MTGTDTNVGKTVVSAALMLRYRDEAPLRYWKPIQTGIERDDDSAEVARLAQCCEDEIFNCGVRRPRAVSPHLAARLSGTRITCAPSWSSVRRSQTRAATPLDCRRPGGVLVPINERETMADVFSGCTFRARCGALERSAPSSHAPDNRALPRAGIGGMRSAGGSSSGGTPYGKPRRSINMAPAK